MIFQIFLVCGCLLSVSGEKICYESGVPGYYWREYRGKVPPDAVPGGTDRTGKTTYIGMAMINEYGILPATIRDGNITAVASSHYKVLYDDRFPMVLCSNDHSKFLWIPTNTKEVGLITECSLVHGGLNGNEPRNIGRINYDGQLLIGKVSTTYEAVDGLWIPVGDTEKRFLSYEILAYDCKNAITIR